MTSFAGLPFDVALRHLLTRSGFRLPGEAQKIDRITSAFAAAFSSDNPLPLPLSIDVTDGSAPPKATPPKGSKEYDRLPAPASIATPDGRLRPGCPDVVEVLAFSCIMLNTDAHNPAVKKEKKMTRAQFVANNRGIDGRGARLDLPKSFLEHLYDGITSNEIKMNVAPVSASVAASEKEAAEAFDAGLRPPTDGSKELAVDAVRYSLLFVFRAV